MIKTIVEEKTEVLDQKVNEFMKARRQNLPVRTEVYVGVNGPRHKATIFYDENFSQKMEDQQPINHEADNTKKENTKIGALWIQENGSVTGNCNEKKTSLDKDDVEYLQQHGAMNTLINGEEVFILKNKYKKAKTHPDYVIFSKRGDKPAN